MYSFISTIDDIFLLSMSCHIIEIYKCVKAIYLPITHYDDVIMGAMASQIPSLTIVYSAFYSGADQRKHQSSASLVPVNSPHKWPITRKMFPFDDVFMIRWYVINIVPNLRMPYQVSLYIIGNIHTSVYSWIDTWKLDNISQKLWLPIRHMQIYNSFKPHVFQTC